MRAAFYEKNGPAGCRWQLIIRIRTSAGLLAGSRVLDVIQGLCVIVYAGLMLRRQHDSLFRIENKNLLSEPGEALAGRWRYRVDVNNASAFQPGPGSGVHAPGDVQVGGFLVGTNGGFCKRTKDTVRD